MARLLSGDFRFFFLSHTFFLSLGLDEWGIL
ncbi:hypothetical protein CCACVL1_14728 [Corchorus capsularis]|uniref:Uncharacterized protein n=1 Tax=Corchorus capsularis TaxID=210143 RepID=A0A1R3I5V6_COCAP|nr:hypothetical protein CCACVL1_14728 [Corchorus capsularis]